MTYTVEGKAGTSPRREDLVEKAESALRQQPGSDRVGDIAVGSLQSRVQERQGYATGEVTCTLDGKGCRGFICSNVGLGGTVVCIAVAPEEMYEHDEAMIKAVAESIRYTSW